MRNVTSVLALGIIVCLFAACPNPGDDNPDPEPTTYQVTYNGNGYTGGTVPTDSADYEAGDTVTITAAGTMVRDRYFFAGWNTAADGAGTWHTPGSTVEMLSQDLVLYAQWPFAMSVVPAKTFNTTMEDDAEDASVTQAFQLAQTEVAYDLWRAVRIWSMGNGYSIQNWGAEGSDVATIGDPPAADPPEPVTLVHWRDAMVWCNVLTEWLNARSGSSYTCVYYSDAGFTTPLRSSSNSTIDTTAGTQDAPYVKADATGFRLPTSSEWELAARYRTDGNNDGDIKDTGEYTAATWASGATANVGNASATGSVAWYAGNAAGAANPVAQKGPNALSLFDMSGNVEEWCFDWMAFGATRVRRGGSWFHGTDPLRVFYKQGGTPIDAEMWLGFRFARNAPGATEPYFVTYVGNGSTGGTVPTDPDVHTASESVTLSDAGTMVRTGYLFQKWNTAANGSGTDYTANQTISMPSGNLMLYAQWAISTFAVTWNGNGNTSGTAPGILTYTYNSTVTVYDNAGMAKANCTFAGWNAAYNGTGTHYVSGTTFAMPAGHITLFAQWAPLAMVTVPAKSFFTGTADGGTYTITTSFLLGKYEVTYDLWWRVRTWAESNGYTFPNDGMEGSNGVIGAAPSAFNTEPVSYVNWRDALVWCNALTEWFNARTATTYTCAYYSDSGYTTPLRVSIDGASINLAAGSVDNPYVLSGATGFRLPTSMEWELAARYRNDINVDGDIKDAGEYYPGEYASGALGPAEDTLDVNPANGVLDGKDYCDRVAVYGLYWNGSAYVATGVIGTANVMSRIPTQLGLYDMGGNLQEWCFDWHPSHVNSQRVDRGSSWFESAGRIKVGSYWNAAPDNENTQTGFRVVRQGP